jgi:ribosomal protein S12 methylthiotransferase
LSRKVALVALGCPKNDVDSEIMMGLLQDRGYEAVRAVGEADVVIVNTCAFIRSAQEEAISAILEAAAAMPADGRHRLVVAGCMAERYKGELRGQMPEVDAVIGTGSIGDTADIIDGLFDGTLEESVFCSLPDSTCYLESRRALSETRPFQYLKVAEGCDNRCTYCIIPSLRGRFRSRPMDRIVQEAEGLVAAGARELILVAQDVTRYGMDMDGSPRLVPLVQALSAIPGLWGIRLLYCYPELIDDALITELRENPKLLPYLDMPVQHIADSVLRRMGRRGEATLIRTLLARLRAEVPGIVLRTSLIAGFPGETQEEFAQLRDFLKTAPFEHVGVFDYSREEGTAAGRMKGQVHPRTRVKRRDELLGLQLANVDAWNASRVDTVCDTIIEGVSDDGLFYLGRSHAEAPDIDPVLFITSEVPLAIGSVVPVRFLCVENRELIAKALVTEPEELST